MRERRVRVDGEVATIGQKIDPERARVEVEVGALADTGLLDVEVRPQYRAVDRVDQNEIDGIVLPVAPDVVYYLMHKERGVISTAHDPQGRTTVVDLVPAEPRVYPVGRLDADSEGLIILTNDGELAQLITHPRFGVEKTYVALVKGVPTKTTFVELTAGVELEDGPARALRARLLDRRSDASLIEIVMGEGRKREVRRMLDHVGHPVDTLVRTAIGPLRDGRLAPGRWRPLELDEVRVLYGAAGRSKEGR